MKKYILLTTFVLFALQSCHKLEVGLANDLNEKDFWKTDADALAVMASCYASMGSAEGFFYTESLSDNSFTRQSDRYGGAKQIASGSYDPSLPLLKNEWTDRYTSIRKCNQFLANVSRVTALSETQLKRYQAEVRFIRAYSYFLLATWYGDVPFFTNVLTISESQSIARTPKAEVIEFIISELEGIQADLPINTALPAAENGRVTRGAAIALKARVNLFEGNWQAAATACEELIGKPENGTYSLFPSYAGIFTVANEYNSEVIFDLQFGANRLYDTQRFFVPVTIGLRTDIMPTQALVDNYITTNGKAIQEAGSGYDASNPFANRDPRLAATIATDGSKYPNFAFNSPAEIEVKTLPNTSPNDVLQPFASATGYYWRKYFDPTATSPGNSGLNLIYLRYADVLLMYAEAKNELNQLTATVWDQTIGALRRRAGFTDSGALNFPNAQQAALRDIVRRERRSELAFESLRIFDIRRWKIAETVLNTQVKGIAIPGNELPKDANGNILVESRVFDPSKHYLWPIPQLERDQNKNLQQNPGWGQ
ncbi:RagB/SusD family nutrient uptake outer membrane protein [Cytophagaceae bacterium DM2B3-1]|uniref:RagB/SusD family nutrient uptake outer membrane protein n=1 Tax=Xanthocytophaga flava TaxID=3048013 RepID=A0ABT7CR31_9BACT|nr:RagB/SusD family nutrient uptake outer membrane protein [Xanthocytophaga flavus]MDJ1496219.1 RagB/SusD family nutrient uptake outer membrane protein [Xanthocytophaga flavus]